LHHRRGDPLDRGGGRDVSRRAAARGQCSILISVRQGVLMPDHLSSVLPEIAARAVKTRRDLHRFPELGMIEFRTASIVAERLTALGLDVKLGREVMDSASRMGMPS